MQEKVTDAALIYAELQQKLYLQQQRVFMPVLLEHRARGEWQEFIRRALLSYEVMPLAFLFYDEVPDNLKYDFCTQAYTHHGDSIPAVRKAVRGALKYGKPILPEHLRELEYIEVYRAGEEPITKAAYRISWTTQKEVALFFLNEWSGRHANHLYKGKIKPRHVIAYTDDRKESEIMQYRHVYDIEEI